MQNVVEMNLSFGDEKRRKMDFALEEVKDKEGNFPKTTVEDLPDEVLEFILSLVSPYKDLRECMLVCKRWRLNVKNVVRLRTYNLTKAINNMHVSWQTITPVDMAPTITKRYSHSACYHDNSMYVFGGCTSTLTTFNDLWRLDLNKRQWVRPLTMGTYPSPKACATMVQYNDALILFGGWTHPSPYPIYQAWRLFSELHIYNIITNRWMCINTPSPPPAMAGHSASIHGDTMVVFGGLKTNLNGQYFSSNDVWCFNFKTQEWHQQQTSNSKPHIRYGQSQISLDRRHVLIIGGCGGPNMIFSDVWLLTMIGDVWQWREIEVRNPEWAALHMWCHPACKVGDQIVMMSRHPKAGKPYLPYNAHNSNHVRATSEVRTAPRENDGIPYRNIASTMVDRDVNINGQRGSFIRSSQRNQNQRMSDNKSAGEDENNKGTLAADINQPGSSGMKNNPSTSGTQHAVSGSIRNVSSNQSVPSNSPKSLSVTIRMKTYSGVVPAWRSSWDRRNVDQSLGRGNHFPSFEMAAFRDQCPHPSASQMRGRERLQALQRFEDRLRATSNSRGVGTAHPEVTTSSSPPRPHRAMAVYVMDITNVLNDESSVKWLALRPEESFTGGPEETILYTLVVGRGELIMFGGIQKDALSITNQIQPQSTNNVSNSLHFISAPRDII